MLGCMFLLSAWMYIKYSGEYSEFGEVIDQICVAVQDNIFSRLTENICSNPTNEATRMAVEKLSTMVMLSSATTIQPTKQKVN